MSQTPATRLKIALAQANPIVGDLDANIAKLRAMRARARPAPTSIVFPELFVTGYPPEDLVLKPAFQTAAREPRRGARGRDRRRPRRAHRHRVAGGRQGLQRGGAPRRRARSRPSASRSTCPTTACSTRSACSRRDRCQGPINFRGVRLGVPICEDIWGPDVTECLAECGAEILISPNGSPFDWTKPDVRMNRAVARVTETGLPLAYLNQVGGQDELVFDGASFVLNADCSLAAQLPAWEETVAVTEWRKTPSGWHCEPGAARDHRGGRCGGLSGLRARTCATTWRRTAFPASSSGCRAASTVRSSPRWPSTRWGRSACMP